MFRLIYFLFLTLAVLSVTAVGLRGDIDLSSRELSNAARLARGLPLRSPKFGRFLPGRSTPVHVARTATPSLVPVNGNIQVTRADTGALVGYVDGTGDIYDITSDLSSALKVAFTSGSNPLQLTETPPTDVNNPFLGGATRTLNLGTGVALYAIITGTSHTAAGAPPSSVGNTYGEKTYDTTYLAESTIWNYNSVTNELTATWINHNLAAAPTYLYYLPSLGLLLVGDPVVFNNAFHGGYLVKWTVV